MPLPPPPPRGEGERGVVIVASGADEALLFRALATCRAIRRGGSRLPVELFHIGASEAFAAAARRELAALGGVTLRDLRAAPVAAPIAATAAGRLRFHAKPYAVLASRFAELLLLDADVMLFQPPERFFARPGPFGALKRPQRFPQ